MPGATTFYEVEPPNLRNHMESKTHNKESTPNLTVEKWILAFLHIAKVQTSPFTLTSLHHLKPFAPPTQQMAALT